MRDLVDTAGWYSHGTCHWSFAFTAVLGEAAYPCQFDSALPFIDPFSRGAETFGLCFFSSSERFLRSDLLNRLFIFVYLSDKSPSLTGRQLRTGHVESITFVAIVHGASLRRSISFSGRRCQKPVFTPVFVLMVGVILSASQSTFCPVAYIENFF